MSLTQYEKGGHFKQELGFLREIGMQLNTLETQVTGERAFREPEREALREARSALAILREEIVATMNMARG